ncbi:MAG: hypothetical protein J0L64_08885 [Acidobacteria bacterium]|nr:hypothetical protein [Acidobacteriota bacterium]
MALLRSATLATCLVLAAPASPVIVSGNAFYHPTSGADTITFYNIVLGSPLLITRLDLTIGNGINNLSATRSLFFDLPGGPAGFGSASAYSTAGTGLITGIQTVDTPGDGLSDRTLAVTYTSWASGGEFVISLDVDRLSNNLQQGSGGTNCNNCDNINGQDFIDGGAISFRLWLSSADARRVIVEPNWVDVTPSQWARTSSNDAIASWSTELDVRPAEPEAVPEPGTMSLCAAALLALGLWGRKRNATSHSSDKDSL